MNKADAHAELGTLVPDNGVPLPVAGATIAAMLGPMTDEQAFTGQVVVGFDGSDSATRAAQWAADEARVRGRGLTLVHAIMPPVTTGGLGVGLPPSLDLIDQLETQALDELDTFAATLADVETRTHVGVGAASGVLLEASESADLVVVGSRGRGGFRGLLLGSVGAQVAAHAACPVAVIRQPAPAGARTVVVGIDGSPAAEAALAFAFDEASHHGWSLVAIHAWDVPAYDLLIVPNGPVPIPLSDVADDEIRLTAEVLAGFRDDYPDVDVVEQLVRSPAVPALLSAAADAAVIVIGTHGHGPAMGALLGSVSNGLLHKSTVPVVVVPPVDPGLSAA
jgi:nucleotide-binding universal stress UspA family protein